VGLVDKVGFQRDAVAEAARLAKLDNPRIVQYSTGTSLRQLLMGAQQRSSLIDRELLEKVSTPQILMLWRPD